MTPAYAVGTDWAIHWLHGNERVRKRLEELLTNNRCHFENIEGLRIESV